MEQSPTVLDTSPEPYYEYYLSGFPFDDNAPRGRQDIRAHLEDLAQRHPEFADQLRCPPWGGEVGPSQGTWSRSRQGSSGDNSSPFQQSSEQEKVDEPGPLRGRSRENNLPQHGLRNTVDLGKQQHEAELEKSTRGQRSMSAPPDNRSTDQPQRFVSRIDINPLSPGVGSSGEGKPPMAPKQQPSPQKPAGKPSQQSASNVRHIPIFVEGRDEPIIPKNIDSTPEKVFSERTIPTQTAFPSERIPPQQAPFVERSIPTQTAFPSERMGRPQSPFAERVIPTHTVPPQQSFGFSRPSHFTAQPTNGPQGKSFSKQQQQQQPPPPPQQQNELPPEQHPKAQPPPKPQPKAPHPADPLFQVQTVENDVEELSKKVESYNGNSRKDKDYIYLDEMLTRNLLKLDNIETEGKENVRQARKSVIRNIQRCISLLESKVPTPEESMEVVEGSQPEQAGTESSLPEGVAVVGQEEQNVETGTAIESTEQAPIPDKPAVVGIAEQTAEVTEQPVVSASNLETVSKPVVQPCEPMNVEGNFTEVADALKEGLAEVVKSAEETLNQEPAPSCVEMSEATSSQQGETCENKPAESSGQCVEVAGDKDSSELMEVDSGSLPSEGQGEVKVDTVPSANTELASGDQPPTKTKKGGKKSPAKGKKSAPQS